MNSEDFQRVKERDKALLPPGGDAWMLRWEWAQQYHQYHGPEDLIRWFQWGNVRPHYFTPEQIALFAGMSEVKNRKVVRELSRDTPYSFKFVDEYNATDYLFQNLYPVPSRMRVRRILDFGAGYGRQINLWSQLHADLVYVGMDAIELPYCLQNFYYKQFDLPLRDYIEEPGTFRLEEDPGIYHVPTWRSDLLPPDFFDLVICVQVLQEINEQLVRHMIDVFRRCLKPGGALYIRDHDLVWQPAHRLDLNRYLVDHGFVLEFRPYVVDNHPSIGGASPDIHGIPRLWRKVDPAYPLYAAAIGAAGV